MPIPDRELPETLDLIAKLVASLSTRLDTHGEALDRLAKAQAQAHTQAQAAASPDRVAQATAAAVQGALVPHLHKIIDVMQELNGTKAILRERLRVVSQEEARASWWRRHVPLSLTLLGAYALVLVFGLAFPRAMAEHSLTCWAIGGTWYGPDLTLPATCTFWLPAKDHAETS